MVRQDQPWVAIAFLAAAMLFDPIRDSVGVPSAAFAATLAIASLTFSYARTLKDGSYLKNELVFAGERLLNGGLAFLFAVIFRHATQDVPRYLTSLFEVLPRRLDQPPDTTYSAT
jgi:hypothetical protein